MRPLFNKFAAQAARSPAFTISVRSMLCARCALNSIQHVLRYPYTSLHVCPCIPAAGV